MSPRGHYSMSPWSHIIIFNHFPFVAKQNASAVQISHMICHVLKCSRTVGKQLVDGFVYFGQNFTNLPQTASFDLKVLRQKGAVNLLCDYSLIQISF